MKASLEFSYQTSGPVINLLGALSMMQQASQIEGVSCRRVPCAQGLLNHALSLHEHVLIQHSVASSPLDGRRAAGVSRLRPRVSSAGVLQQQQVMAAYVRRQCAADRGGDGGGAAAQGGCKGG